MKLLCLDCYSTTMDFPNAITHDGMLNRNAKSKCPTCGKDWAISELL